MHSGKEWARLSNVADVLSYVPPLSGLDLLRLSEHEMYVDLGLSELRIRKLRKLQVRGW